MGNEKQAGQKKGGAWLPPHDAPEGKAWLCPECPSWATLAENAHAHQIAASHGRPTVGEQPRLPERPAAPPPPSAEKPLLGEPQWTVRKMLDALLPRVSPTLDAALAARAYLATRAQPEERLVKEGYRLAVAERALHSERSVANLDARDLAAAELRTCARALVSRQGGRP